MDDLHSSRDGGGIVGHAAPLAGVRFARRFHKLPALIAAEARKAPVQAFAHVLSHTVERMYRFQFAPHPSDESVLGTIIGIGIRKPQTLAVAEECFPYLFSHSRHGNHIGNRFNSAPQGD
jgi:hypothetical protein